MVKRVYPRIKNSFWKLYKKTIQKIVFSVGGVCAVYGIYTVGNFLCKKYHTSLEELFVKYGPQILAIMLALCVFACLLKFFIRYFKFLLNQRRVPLTAIEIESLNLKTAQDYGQYLDEFLYGFCPKKEILYRIVISAVIYYNLPDLYGNECDLGKVFDCSMDFKDEAIFDVDVDIRCKSVNRLDALVNKINPRLINSERYFWIRMDYGEKEND